MINLYDYEKVAQEKIAKSIWGYYASGADDQKTLARNRTTLGNNIAIMPKALRGNKKDQDRNAQLLKNSHDLTPLNKKKLVLGINTKVRLFSNNPKYSFEIDSPICVAPTAMQRMAHPDGELATARACAK